jgi:predicted dehydrogenase
MQGQVRAAVVGAGAIGARMDGPGAPVPFTHAGGYTAAGFSLVAFMDPDPAARALAEQWGCSSFADFDAMMHAAKPQVLSFAVPAAERPALLRRALAFRPLAVIAEKPLAPSSADAEPIVKAYREAGIPLVVNYTRRFVPAWQRMRGGSAMSTTIRYAKGLRHNGTHAIDLCRMLFGECLGSIFLAKKTDCWSDDPTVSAFLRFERCPEVFLQSLDERCFTLFEADIVAATSRVVVDSDGRRFRHFAVRDGVGIPPGKRLVEVETTDIGAVSAMACLMQHLRDVLSGAEPLCSGEDAVAAQKIAEQIWHERTER